MNFVHLHRHSEWSILDGLGTGEQYAGRAAELGQSALAITDHGTLAGALYHVQACEANDIKPIIGIETYFRPDVLADREASDRYGYTHLVLLAKNYEGFTNLIRLSSLSYTEKYFYQKPNIDWEILRKHSNGLIASSSCAAGYLPRKIVEDNDKEAKKYLRVMQDIFGDDYYLEIQPHDFDEQRLINISLANMSMEFGIPLVAAQDVHYPYQDWHDTQDVALMLATGQTLKKRYKADEEDKDYLKFAGETFWLTSAEEISKQFEMIHSDFPKEYVDESIKNSGEIADRCEHYSIDKSPKVPKATKSTLEAERIIREWCNEGLERIGKQNDQIYLDRLETELSVMRKLKVFDYFVIVGDMVRWAKSNGIRVGPGRGSATGCLVNYLIRITAVDPIGYNLLFERFLNEYRTEMPDIDIDFQHDRRDEVKQYLVDKWGADHVVDVAAFQSFGFKAAIKDISRVLDVPFDKATRAADVIPKIIFGETMETIEAAYPEVRLFFREYPEVRKHAMRLQGQIKNLSRHAGAVIVTDRPATELIPTMRAKDGGTVTQWSERANAQLISPYGFLKIDMLATDDLTNQADSFYMAYDRGRVKCDTRNPNDFFEDNEKFPVNVSPLEVDQDIIQAFGSATNTGIFQFGGSRGIVSLLKEIKPENLEHVIACNALYRPGTLANGMAYDYALRKNNQQNWKLVHPSLEPFVGYTFGIMVYQEQVMQMYKALGKDVTDSASAIFLKVVSKGIARDVKGKEKLQAYYENFASGCKEKGISKNAYDEIWSQILQMTTYAFNKSHSTGYALQAYQDKWIQMRLTQEFYTSLLTREGDKIPQIVKESKIFGVRLLPPDINKSDVGFTIDGNFIRFGLLAVSYIGDSAIQVIKEGRPYKSYEDFCDRVPRQKVNSRAKTHLLQSGAFDELGARDDLSEKEKATGEKESIGFVVSRKSEVDQYKDIIKEYASDPDEMDDMEDEAFAGGEVVSIKEHVDKKGNTMAFVDINFGTFDYPCTFFSNKYEEYRHMLGEGSAILVKGKWDKERRSLTVDHACTAEQLAIEMRIDASRQ